MTVHGTSRYTHLGAVQSANMKNDAEVTMRIIKAKAAHKDIKRKILGNPAIEVQRKCHLAQAIIFSRLLFGTETWDGLTAKQEAKLNTFLFHVYRSIVKKISRGADHKFSNLEIEASLVCTKIQALMKLQRLRYFRKLGVEAPTLLLNLLDREDQEGHGSWFSLIREDLEWVRLSSQGQEDTYDGVKDLGDWWRKAMKQGKAWDRHITKLVLKEAMEEHIVAKQKWNGQISSVPKMPAALGGQGKENTCEICGALFHGAAALANHLWKKHQLHAKVRYYIHDTACGQCLRDFHSLQRLRQHLQYSEACFTSLCDVWEPTEPISMSETVDSTAYRVPWVQRHGPRLPTRSQWRLVAPERVFPSSMSEDADLVACISLCREAATSLEATELETSWQECFFS